MKKHQIIPVWGRILRGYKPFLSLEITKECPLRCPGCYAYEDAHLNNGSTLRQLSDYKGDELVDKVIALVDRYHPMHISIVGGEPLVRYRELSVLIPLLDKRGVEVQLVTSAVRQIPMEWAAHKNLHLAVSIDGLQPEHDERRKPATYDRILQHIAGHNVIVHCTITKQQLARPGYLREFSAFWSAQEIRNIWFSLFTPQEGDDPAERLTPQDRINVVAELALLREEFPKVYAPAVVTRGYEEPPTSPEECLFAQVTTCFSADFTTPVTPCQLGGRPKCDECGCMASAGLASVGRTKLAGAALTINDVFNISRKFGDRFGPGSKNGASSNGASRNGKSLPEPYSEKKLPIFRNLS